MFKKILVATDGSEHSMKAVQTALELAEKDGSKVTLLSIPFYSRSDLEEMPPNIQDKLEAESQQAIRRAKGLFAEKNLSVETIVEPGHVPANIILRTAEEGNFDLILLGSTGLKGIKRMLIGSTASKVVSLAPCTVTVVR